MSFDLRELYQSVIMDHNKRPRNFRALEDADRSAEGQNPLCGDEVTVFVVLDDGVVEDVAFQGSGCAISTAAASLMTEAVKGKSVAEAERIFDRYHEMVTGDPQQEPKIAELGKLAAFAGVREFPMRVKCATLAWHTLKNALEGRDEVVSTE